MAEQVGARGFPSDEVIKGMRLIVPLPHKIMHPHVEMVVNLLDSGHVGR